MNKPRNGHAKQSNDSNVLGFAHATQTEVEDVGQIGAGRNVEFLPNADKVWITRPATARANDRLIRVCVSGDSLKDDGIRDGDYLICRTNFDEIEIRNGALIVARIIEANETTIKRIVRDGDLITLCPANPLYSDKTYHVDEIEIQAVALELVRSL